METIECYISDDELHGVFAMGLVSAPAIEKDWIMLNAIQLKADASRRVLTGPALIPEKRIMRINPTDGAEYLIFFAADTIQKVSEAYLKRNKHHTATIEHEFAIPGVSIIESWIVSDSEKDKSAALGMDLPVGTWMISAKIDNAEVWDGMISEGLLKGFSIEGQFANRPASEIPDDDILSELARILSR